MTDHIAAEQGGSAQPAGTLTRQVNRELPASVIRMTSELSAKKLRRDPTGSVVHYEEDERPARFSEMSMRERVRWFLTRERPIEYVPREVRYRVVEDYGVVSRKVVTTVGVTDIANSFINTFEPETYNYHAAGTGSTAEAIGDTALVTEVETRIAGTQSSPSAGQYRTVGVVAFTATRTINEHGIFNQLATGGRLFDRSMFSGSPIGVVNGDSIQFTYTVTFTAGG